MSSSYGLHDLINLVKAARDARAFRNLGAEARH